MTWSDARLARLVRRCREVPGQVLFQWLDENGGRHPVRSNDVNDYVRRVGGIDVTAKTFRTWGATLLAAVGYAAVADTPAPLRAQVSREVISAVAAELGNTPAVCRASYVHPGVVEAFHLGTLASRWRAPKRRSRQLLPEEHRLLYLLEQVDAKPLELGPGAGGSHRRAGTTAEELQRARQHADETIEAFADRLRSH
jgi:DNA topoisomerase-1